MKRINITPIERIMVNGFTPALYIWNLTLKPYEDLSKRKIAAYRRIVRKLESGTDREDIHKNTLCGRLALLTAYGRKIVNNSRLISE